ncbi:hypothetical protein [Streptomyces sp. NPDC001657]|uniref:hypothetical protein n=1 Tax=Streptomyces sp. NPDC001657 TaxID=3154522 RepID=UPI00332C5C83
MADTTSSTPDRPDPDRMQTARPGQTVAGAGRVRFSLVRWLLAPRTTWRARRLAAEFGPGMDARTAWTMARLARHPDEHVCAMAHLDGDDRPSPSGPGAR